MWPAEEKNDAYFAHRPNRVDPDSGFQPRLRAGIAELPGVLRLQKFIRIPGFHVAKPLVIAFGAEPFLRLGNLESVLPVHVLAIGEFPRIGSADVESPRIIYTNVHLEPQFLAALGLTILFLALPAIDALGPKIFALPAIGTPGLRLVALPAFDTIRLAHLVQCPPAVVLPESIDVEPISFLLSILVRHARHVANFIGAHHLPPKLPYQASW